MHLTYYSAVLREVTTPPAAQSLIDLLHTVISFVTSSGGSLLQSTHQSQERLGKMSLGQYVKEVLMLEDTGNGSGSNGGNVMGMGMGMGMGTSRVVQQQVQLTHLEALHTLLITITSTDSHEDSDLFFSRVHEAYKQPLHPL
jgi:hypothetical protein